MSTYPGQAAAKNRTLTWLAIACFVVGLALTGFFAWRIVETAPRSPQSIEGGVAVHLQREGLTVYSSVPVLQAPCEAKDANGADVPLKPSAGSERITINSQTWYVVARSVHAVPPGDYVVTCDDDETSATYAVGPRSSVIGFVLSILGAIGSFLAFFVVGVILLVLGIVKNRRRNRPGPTFPTAPGAPGNYPPPGNTFPPPTAPGAPGTYLPPGNTFPPPTAFRPPPTAFPPQPSTGSQPQPSTGPQPQPSTGSEPQPSTGSEPQPSTGPQPQPSTGSEPQSSTGPQPQPPTAFPRYNPGPNPNHPYDR